VRRAPFYVRVSRRRGPDVNALGPFYRDKVEGFLVAYTATVGIARVTDENYRVHFVRYCASQASKSSRRKLKLR
jgi:hypothetical protein